MEEAVPMVSKCGGSQRGSVRLKKELGFLAGALHKRSVRNHLSGIVEVAFESKAWTVEVAMCNSYATHAGTDYTQGVQWLSG